VGWIFGRITGKLTVLCSDVGASSLIAGEKCELIEKILQKQLGSYIRWMQPKVAPLLGPRYSDEIVSLRASVSDFIANQRRILGAQDHIDLQKCYDQDGQTQIDELKIHWREVRSDAPVGQRTSVINLAGLGKPNLVADYEHWSRMEWIELKEALWLAVGLDPRRDWSTMLTPNGQRKPGHRRELDFLDEQLEPLLRFVMRVEPIHKRFRGPELLVWIEATGFPVHPDFIKMLKSKASRVSNSKSKQKNDDSRKGTPVIEDPRAVRTVAKIIAAIAIEEYGYDPSGIRSPIPKEIESICDRQGLAVSRETILQYLRIGAKQIDDGKN